MEGWQSGQSHQSAKLRSLRAQGFESLTFLQLQEILWPSLVDEHQLSERGSHGRPLRLFVPWVRSQRRHEVVVRSGRMSVLTHHLWMIVGLTGHGKASLDVRVRGVVARPEERRASGAMPLPRHPCSDRIRAESQGHRMPLG